MENPFCFGKSLLDPPKSGTLRATKQELDEHFRLAFKDPLSDSELPERTDFPEVQLPKVAFDGGEIKMNEVSQFLKKTRNKSAPGPNGIPYLLYKRCPGVQKLLYNRLKIAWRSRCVDREWQKAEGVFIPKEKDSVNINQFRPISLLNVEGKIFFAVLAKRLTDFAIRNEYIDRSLQKGGVPGVPGCIEHSSMIWEAIKRAKQNQLSLHVVWLDLANAYGTVRHQLLWKTLKRHNVPEFLIDVLQQYFRRFRLRLSTSTCSTEWFNLRVGIAMGCSISPILFVLAMQLLLGSIASRVQDVYLGKGIFMPSIKAFMDDTTLILNHCGEMRRILQNFNDLLSWCGMKFKPTKSRSLSLRHGEIDGFVSFSVAGCEIPTIQQEPVKSLGRWYNVSMNDVNRSSIVLQGLVEDLRKINSTELQGKFKVWLVQFVLIPRLLWPLTIYEICLSHVERMEKKMNCCIRKWLGLPPALTTLALYSKSAKLALPFKSLVEEYKISKIRTQLMLDNSSDPCIVNVGPSVGSGKGWTAGRDIREAEGSLQWSEKLGAVQPGRLGLGWFHHVWWSKASSQERTNLIIQDRRRAMELERVQLGAQMSQQGDWTRWEAAVQHSMTWNDLWRYSPIRLSFVIRAMYDQLPTASNLVKWGKLENEACKLCEKTETLIHILSCCPYALAKGRYTWRHNEVLREILGIIKENCRLANSMQLCPRRKVYFLREGLQHLGRRKASTRRESLLDAANDWRISADLKDEDCFPELVRSSGLRPDIVIFSSLAKTLLFIELTVPWESNMEASNILKEERYRILAQDLERAGYRVEIFPVEVGARGLAGRSLVKLLVALGMSGRKKTQAIKKIAERAETASFWIWMQRNEKGDNKFKQPLLASVQQC